MALRLFQTLKMSQHLDSLIPFRFMSLIGHFVLLVMLIWSRDETVRSCVDWDKGQPSNQELRSKDAEITTLLSLSIAFVVIEMIGFISGTSTFFPLQTVSSSALHSIGIICLGYFIIDYWDCSILWLIFTVTSFIPFFSELILIFSVFVGKRSL